MKTLAGLVLVFSWGIGLLVFRAYLVRVEGGSSLPDVAWNWARPKTEKGKRLARLMGLWLVLYPVLVTLIWWLLF